MLIILDRDGVINEDSDEFIKSPAEWQAIPSSLQAIRYLNQQGHCIVVATNQSGVSRGYFSLATLAAIHHRMQQTLANAGAYLDGVYFCPHRTEDHCSCRKPLPGMIWQILKDFQVKNSETIVIGDSLRDIQAGQAAGCQTVLVKTGKGQETLVKNQGLDDVVITDNLLVWSMTKAI